MPQTITSLEYAKLDNPIFLGQSRADKDGNYIMKFSSEGKEYIIKSKL